MFNPAGSKLNPEQQEAVNTLTGPLLVLAGAGTGKTRVIVNRIARMISSGVAPANILAVTFTNKAAQEMRTRVAKLLRNGSGGEVTASTFHALCCRIMRTHAGRLGYTAGFVIANDSYQSGLIRSLLTERGFVGPEYDPRDFLAAVHRWKAAVQTPAAALAAAVFPDERLKAEVYGMYQTRLKILNMLDFDDLLLLPLELWHEYPQILENYREQYQYILVDEYQDTNPVQFQLVKQLAGPRMNVCVVGDDDQSIYGWRGADISNILSFQEHFPGAKVIRLEQNYRSTKCILQAANSVIANNRERHPKKLWCGGAQGEPVLLVGAMDDEDEAKFVGELVRDRHITGKIRWQDMALLYRSNHQSRLFEAVLRKVRVPYRIVGGNSFFERKEIIDAVSFLRCAANPNDDMSFLQIINTPPRGFGDKALGRLKEWQRILSRPLFRIACLDEYLRELPAEPAAALGNLNRCLERYIQAFQNPGELGEKVRDFLNDSGYIPGLGRMYKPKEDALRRRENVFEFINAAAEYQERRGAQASLGDFLETMALTDENDRVDKDGEGEDRVTLMTVHAAKGLEFPLVIVVGLENSLFPHKHALEEKGLAEERRLFYVAMTRAQHELVLVHAHNRRVRGQKMRRRPSPFLDEITPETLHICTPANALKPAPDEEVDAVFAQLRASFASSE